jgi:Ca2+-binding EF-hand superfamily protein
MREWRVASDEWRGTVDDEPTAPPNAPSPSLSPLSTRGRGAGGEGATRDNHSFATRPLTIVFALLAFTLLSITLIAKADDQSGSSDDAQDLVYLAPNGPQRLRLHLRVDGQPLTALQTAIARQLFDTLDADSNGVLEGKELEGIPSPALVAVIAKTTPKSSTAVPKDRVTPENLAAYLAPYPFKSFALNFETAAKPGMSYRGRVVPDGMQRATSLDLSTFLSALDLDGDGRVTVAECARANDLFHRLDLNDDETVSREEITEVAAGRAAAAKGPSNPLNDLASRLQLVDRSGVPLELSRLISDRYRRMSTTQAAAWLAESSPRVELDVALPKKTLQSPTVTGRQTATVAGEGVVIRGGSAGSVVVELGSLPLELHAAESPPRPVDRTAYMRGIFKRADGDGNNYLDLNEFRGTNLGLDSEDFKAIDADHNGMIFEKEWLSFMTLYQIVSDNRVTLTIGLTATDPFAQFDANSDGRLTHGEWLRAMAAVQKWDTNHDGAITPDELPSRLVGTFHLGTMRPAPSSPTMYDAKTPAVASDAPTWFQKMDRNRDGEVSLREFLGPLSVFRRLDANHDGYLDVNEARGVNGEAGREEK